MVRFPETRSQFFFSKLPLGDEKTGKVELKERPLSVARIAFLGAPLMGRLPMVSFAEAKTHKSPFDRSNRFLKSGRLFTKPFLAALTSSSTASSALRRSGCGQLIEVPRQGHVDTVLIAAKNLRSVAIEGDVLILDLTTGRYSLFQPPQSLWWQALLGASTLDARPCDLAEFRTAMLAKGWLVAPTGLPARLVPSSQPIRASTRGLGTALALRFLVSTDRAIARGEFPALYDSLLRWRAALNLEARASMEVSRSFLRAEALLFWRRQEADCLPRSLALFRLCLRRGVAAEHVIGVRRAPFGAHAWVRIGDRCVLDSDEFVSDFTPIAVI